MIRFTVPGAPKGKARPRVTKAGHAFTPKGTVEYENWVKQCFVLSGQKGCLEGQIEARIKAFFPIPRSTSQSKRIQMVIGKIQPAKKPDIDNIAKSVLDALNGMAYQDDSQIVKLIIEKWYSNDPHVEVELIELGDDKICPEESDQAQE